MSKPTDRMILIREPLAVSLLRDAGSFMALASLIGLGWFIQSTVMEYMGAFIGMLFIFGRVSGARKQYEKSLEEAAQQISEWQEEAKNG